MLCGGVQGGDGVIEPFHVPTCLGQIEELLLAVAGLLEERQGLAVVADQAEAYAGGERVGEVGPDLVFEGEAVALGAVYPRAQFADGVDVGYGGPEKIYCRTCNCSHYNMLPLKIRGRSCANAEVSTCVLYVYVRGTFDHGVPCR